MEITRQGEGFQITLSQDELGTLGNCLNEALEIIHPSEFQMRVGAERSEVLDMLRTITNAYDRRPT